MGLPFPYIPEDGPSPFVLQEDLMVTNTWLPGGLCLVAEAG
jgi:hypothetical protein